MTHPHLSKRRVIAATCVAALLAGSFAAAQATAITLTSPHGVLSSTAAGTLAQPLTGELHDDAGAYYDAATGRLVVNVVNEAAAVAVHHAGAEARVVNHTLAELNETKTEVAAFAVPGTAWTVDPVSNAVKVTVDSTVTGADLREVRNAVESLGDQAVLETVEGEFQSFVAGGDAIASETTRCSLGFNVTTSGGQPGFLTAGHCGSTGSSWSDSVGGAEIGVMTERRFPGADYALVEYTAEVDAPSAVNLHNGTTQEITDAGDPFVGQMVQRSGSTTGVQTGMVTGLDVSVRYPEGVVDGLIRTTVCAEPGDSGGALFAGGTALGLTSGGTGDCTFGGMTFFYPVTDALAAVGATLP